MIHHHPAGRAQADLVLLELMPQQLLYQAVDPKWIQPSSQLQELPEEYHRCVLFGQKRITAQ